MPVVVVQPAPEAVVQTLWETPLVERLRTYFAATADAVTREHIALTEIPAPPFHEAKRAEFLAERLRESGLPTVRRDAEGNVIGCLPGTDPAQPPMVLAAHLDTVFPPETDVTVRFQGKRLCAPGIADNACGLAGLLALARAFVRHDVQLAGSVWFVGTVGEEGPGNLRGVRALVNESPHMCCFIALDGPGIERITCRAIGARRFRVTFGGPGGHSWANFGTVNPIHALGEFVHLVRRFSLRRGMTCTVASVDGGGVINAIPTEAHADLDCRAYTDADLEQLETEVRLAAVQAQQAEMEAATQCSRLTATVQRLGDRPAKRRGRQCWCAAPSPPLGCAVGGPCWIAAQRTPTYRWRAAFRRLPLARAARMGAVTRWRSGMNQSGDRRRSPARRCCCLLLIRRQTNRRNEGFAWSDEAARRRWLPNDTVVARH